MKLLVSDFDGTFHTDEESIKVNCEILKNFLKEGNYFMLSTGRAFDSIKRKIEEYDIPCNYIGTSDGSFLLDKDGKVILENNISSDVVDNMQEFTDLATFERIQYAYPETNLLEYDKERSLASIAYVIKKENISSQVLELFENLKNRYSNYQFDIYGYDELYFFLVRPKGISKSTPVDYLSKILSIPKKEIYTIGDNSNDFEMIRDYNGYMIGNNEKLKSVALKKYDAFYELVQDINNKKVLKRW